MRLYTNCKNCKEEVQFSVIAKDRFVLARKRGEAIDLNCTSCGARKSYHVNEINAEEKKSIQVLAALILLIGTTALFLYLWPILLKSSIMAVAGLVGILAVPSFVYKFLNEDERNRVSYFNTKHYG